jgi:hypothetical protein
MPIPKPKSKENEGDYMGRCMTFLNKEGETPRPQDQKVAICLNTFRGPQKKAKGEIEIDFTEEIKNINKLKEVKLEQPTNTAVTAPTPEIKIEKTEVN